MERTARRNSTPSRASGAKLGAPVPWSEVLAFPYNTHGITNPRRGINFPVPGLLPGSYFRCKAKMFERFGLDDYQGVVTAEPLWRPSPHVVDLSDRMLKFRAVYAKYAPMLFRRMRSELKPAVQVFNKDSRLGWPYCARSADKRVELVTEIQAYWNDPERYFDRAFTIMNVRLQPEPSSKEREYQVPYRGRVYEKTMTQEDKLLPSPPGLPQLYASRTRLVFSRPCLNLYTQVVDTIINNWLSSNAVHHHDMYGGSWRGRLRPHVLAFDIKHMERFTAAIMEPRYQLLQGGYTDIHRGMDSVPYLTPNLDFRSWTTLRGLPSDKIVQFGSGHSAVADSQKEALDCLLTEAHVQLWGYAPEQALDCVLKGSSTQLEMLNYGDDNLVSAFDPVLLDELFTFLGGYLDVVKEDPPGFLGFKLYDGELRLPPQSYVLKTWLHERAPLGRFRKYPFLGWVLKRRVFLEYGLRRQMEEVFEYENRILSDEGLLWSDIERAARNEERELAGLVEQAHPLVLLGKEYLLTDEERLALGTFTGWPEEKTAACFRELTGGGILEGAL